MNSAVSIWSHVTSRIPQGSVLGTLLVLLFIIDMPDDIMISIKIFADHTKAFKDVQTEDDMLILQKGVAEKGPWVLFDRKLSIRQHIGSMVKKVNRMIGLTRRTFHYMDGDVFRLLYTSLMRPHMDYADCI